MSGGLPTVTPNPLGSPPKILPESTAPVFLKPASPTWPGKFRGVTVFGVVGREKPPVPHPPHGVVVVGTRWPNKLAKEQRRARNPTALVHQLSWNHQQ